MSKKTSTKRINFASSKILEYPDLLEVQVKSFKDFFQLETTPENRKGEGLYQVFQELVRADLLDKRIAIGLDFFDAQVNRVTAWIVGLRAAGKALLSALLEPTAQMVEAEYAGNLGKRMAMLDECKNLPVNAVWDYLCYKKGAGVGMSWLDEMDRYEKEVQFKRV